MAKIMVVEDEVTTALQLEGLLTSSGHEVVGVASSGKEAVDLARKCRPELILMDIVLPGGVDGIEAAEQIKAELGVPSIFLTGYGTDELVKRAKRLLPLGYLVKPLNEEQVTSAIEIALYKEEIDRRLREKEKELEHLVELRTRDLANAKKELEARTLDLEETNTALRVLLKKREEDRVRIGKDVLVNVKELIQPYLERLKQGPPDHEQRTCLSNLESNLEDIISPFLNKLTSDYSSLTPTEIRVAYFVREGKTSKEIGQSMGICPKTVDFHRASIRMKLGLSDRTKNLRSHLLSL